MRGIDNCPAVIICTEQCGGARSLAKFNCCLLPRSNEATQFKRQTLLTEIQQYKFSLNIINVTLCLLHYDCTVLEKQRHSNKMLESSRNQKKTFLSATI